jgi:ribose transport system permease protein
MTGSIVEGARTTRPLTLADRLAGSKVAWGAAVPLGVLWLVLAVASPYFLTPANLINILLQAAIIGILAFGSTVAMISEEIDLSVGALEGFTAVVAGIVVVWFGLPWPLGVVSAICCGMLIGVANGLITTIIGIPSFITTLAMLGITTGLALSITEGNAIYGFPDVVYSR